MERQDTLKRRLKYDENKRKIGRKMYEPKEEWSKVSEDANLIKNK